VDIWEAAGRPPSGARPGENEVVAKSRSRGDIVRYRSFTPTNNVEGDIDALSLWSGQSVGIVADVKSVSAIMSDIVREAGEILKNASNRFDD
jgi:NAD(P)H-dependent flavin oxidoreductase YrpB (nitropropane dioxygenase family)